MDHPFKAVKRHTNRVLSGLALPVVACLLLLSASVRSQAASVEVDAGVTGGSCCIYKTIASVPGVGTNTTTINAGDTIHWVWKTNFHSVTSDTGAWTDSGVHNSGFTFDVTFNTAGTFAYHCSIHGGVGTGMSGKIIVVSPTATVTGRIALEGVPDLTTIDSNAPLGTFPIEFRTPGSTMPLFTSTVTLSTTSGSPFGTFSIGSIPAGTYDIGIKGNKSLRVVQKNVVVSGTTALADVTLPAGDATGDNIIDVADFGALVNAYGASASVAGSGYVPEPDFDYSGTLDVADFGLMVNNFGAMGDL